MKFYKEFMSEDAPGSKVGNSISINQHGGSDPYDIQNDDVLKRVNAFVGSIAEQEYLNPKAALEALANKLKTIGLEISPVEMTGDNGKVTAEVKQFGGRFGKDLDGADINDDGISHRKEGGLKLEVSYETLNTGTSKVYAKLV